MQKRGLSTRKIIVLGIVLFLLVLPVSLARQTLSLETIEHNMENTMFSARFSGTFGKIVVFEGKSNRAEMSVSLLAAYDKTFGAYKYHVEEVGSPDTVIINQTLPQVSSVEVNISGMDLGEVPYGSQALGIVTIGSYQFRVFELSLNNLAMVQMTQLPITVAKVAPGSYRIEPYDESGGPVSGGSCTGVDCPFFTMPGICPDRPAIVKAGLVEQQSSQIFFRDVPYLAALDGTIDLMTDQETGDSPSIIAGFTCFSGDSPTNLLLQPYCHLYGNYSFQLYFCSLFPDNLGADYYQYVPYPYNFSSTYSVNAGLARNITTEYNDDRLNVFDYTQYGPTVEGFSTPTNKFPEKMTIKVQILGPYGSGQVCEDWVNSQDPQAPGTYDFVGPYNDSLLFDHTQSAPIYPDPYIGTSNDENSVGRYDVQGDIRLHCCGITNVNGDNKAMQGAIPTVNKSAGIKDQVFLCGSQYHEQSGYDLFHYFDRIEERGNVTFIDENTNGGALYGNSPQRYDVVSTGEHWIACNASGGSGNFRVDSSITPPRAMIAQGAELTGMPITFPDDDNDPVTPAPSYQNTFLCYLDTNNTPTSNDDIERIGICCGDKDENGQPQACKAGRENIRQGGKYFYTSDSVLNIWCAGNQDSPVWTTNFDNTDDSGRNPQVSSDNTDNKFLDDCDLAGKILYKESAWANPNGIYCCGLEDGADFFVDTYSNPNTYAGCFDGYPVRGNIINGGEIPNLLRNPHLQAAGNNLKNGWLKSGMISAQDQAGNTLLQSAPSQTGSYYQQLDTSKMHGALLVFSGKIKKTSGSGSLKLQIQGAQANVSNMLSTVGNFQEVRVSLDVGSANNVNASIIIEGDGQFVVQNITLQTPKILQYADAFEGCMLPVPDMYTKTDQITGGQTEDLLITPNHDQACAIPQYGPIDMTEGSNELCHEVEDGQQECTSTFYCDPYYQYFDNKVAKDQVGNDVLPQNRNTSSDFTANVIGNTSAELMSYFSSVNLPTAIGASCCPENYCWDGSRCIRPMEDNSSDPPVAAPETQNPNAGFRCIAGNWQYSSKKFDPYQYKSGWCPAESDCFWDPGNTHGNEPFDQFRYLPRVNVPQCLKSGQFIGDFYCKDGSWTTRTRLLAEQIKRAVSGSDVTIFCDNNYSNMLNNKNMALGGDIQSVLGNPDINSAVNSFCFINQLGAGNTPFVVGGVSLNENFSRMAESRMQQTLERLNITAGCTPNPSGDFSVCITSNNKVYYNNATDTILFRNEELGITGAPSSWFAIFRNIITFILTALNPQGEDITDRFPDITTVHKLYYAKNGNKEVIVMMGTIHNPVAADLELQSVIVGNYSGFALPLPLCTSLGADGLSTQRQAIIDEYGAQVDCQAESNAFIISILPGMQGMYPVPISDVYWRQITAQLRLQ